MAFKWTVDTAGFRKCAEDLARISGVTYEEALKEQTRLVMQAALRNTPAAKAERIKKAIEAEGRWHTVESDGPVLSENTGTRGGEPGQQWLFWPERSARARGLSRQRRTGGDAGMYYRLPNSRLPADVQSAVLSLKAKLASLQPKKREAIAKALRARGLAKKSWLQASRAVGIDLRDIPSYVSAALASDGVSYENGTGRRITQGETLFFELENRYPALLNAIGRQRRGKSAAMDGYRILQGAIASRISAFNREMALGVIQDVAARARRYPGLHVS